MFNGPCGNVILSPNGVLCLYGIKRIKQNICLYNGVYLAMATLSVRVIGTCVLCRSVISGWTKVATVSSSSSSYHTAVAAAATHSGVKMQMDLSGIYPPIATPFNADETIAYDKLQHNMDKWNKIPFRGMFKGGVVSMFTGCVMRYFHRGCSRACSHVV